MKASIYTILSVATILSALSGCSDKPAADTTPKRMEYAVSSADLPFPSELADSLAELYGYLVAYDHLRRIDTTQTSFDKEAFATGVELVIADTASSAGYTQGAQSAMSILGQIQEYKRKGVTLNIPLLIKGLRDGLNADSVTVEQVSQASSDYNRLLVRALGI